MRWARFAALAAWQVGGGILLAGSLFVPNASFESPTTPFVNTHIDAWEKSGKPDWYEEGNGYYWDQLSGTFKNSAAGSPDHITNCHGAQAAWVFAVPEVGFFQDYDAQAWNEPSPPHAFTARFQPGCAYTATVGVIGGGGGMLPGVTLELSLYYRGAASNLISVTSTTITNSLSVFSNTTGFVDFTVALPQVRRGDAWADHHLGIQLKSTVASELQGGYWDVDNVRLVETPAPNLTDIRRIGRAFEFTVRSDPGLKIEICSTDDARTPAGEWRSVLLFTNTTGAAPIAIPMTNGMCRFFQARQLP